MGHLNPLVTEEMRILRSPDPSDNEQSEQKQQKVRPLSSAGVRNRVTGNKTGRVIWETKLDSHLFIYIVPILT